MLTLKRNDTRRGIKAILKSPAGLPEDLTGADVRFVMVKYSSKKPLVNREALVLDAFNGVVGFDFEPAETTEIGLMLAEFKVTYPDESVERFPNSGYITINFESEL